MNEGIDRIGVGSLDTGVGLKAEPGGVFFIDVVIDASRLHLLMIIAGMRDTLAIGASVSIIGDCRRNSTDIERTTEHSERRSVRIAVERKHLLIERDRLAARRVDEPVTESVPPRRELLQNVVLKCRGWHGRGRDDRQRDANPFAIEKEEQLIVDNRASQGFPQNGSP